MLSYPAAIPLSTRTLNRLSDLLRQRRAELRGRWRRLDPGRQALLVLAHLRNGDTYTRLAAGFAIGTTTARRYVREALDLLATLSDDLPTAMARISQLAYAILDGTLVPIDRIADQKPYYSGKHNATASTSGPRRPRRTTRVGLTRPARLDTRPDRRTHPRSHRRVRSCRPDDLGGQGVSGRWRHGAYASQTPPAPATTVPQPEGGQPRPRPRPRPRNRRTRRRHPQGLEDPDKAAVLPPPRDRDRPGDPCATRCRNKPLPTTKMAQ